MTDPVEGNCPVRPPSQSAKGQIATATVAERVEENPRRDETRRRWIEERGENEPPAEIRAAPIEYGRSGR